MSAEGAALPPDAWRENVAAIVLDAAGRVLLGQDAGRKAHWHFPQGGVGASETLEAALARELQEETGLSPERYRLVASYGGLRYKYRKRNEKSGRWHGQQQTYFLLQCYGEEPPADCSPTDEFAALRWLPWQQLSLDLFVPFKRKVLHKVLETFFPPAAADDPVAYAGRELSPQRYLYAAGARRAGDAAALFGGGKEEAAFQLEKLALRLRAAQKRSAAGGQRLLVLIHGSGGSGRKQCLRRLASMLDPFSRCGQADAFAAGLPWALLAQLPEAGQLSLVLHRPQAPASPGEWRQLEAWLRGQGTGLLKLYLAAEGELPPADARLLAATDTAASPWYVIPSTRRWYRDLVVASLLAGVVEQGAQLPPLA